MQSRYIHVNGLSFHCKESGEGELMLLLHGFPEFWYSWSKIIPLLDRHFKVVAPDMRGYGQSSKPKAVSDYNYKKLTEDIAAIIKTLGYQKAYLVGHDWGGAVAWEFAKLYASMMEKLVIINCPPPIVLFKHILTSWKQFRMSWYIFFFQLPLLPEWYLHSNLKTLFWRMMRGWAFNKDAFPEEVIAQYEHAFARCSDFTGPVNYYRAAFRSLFDRQFRTMPTYEQDTLIIWAEADRALSKELTYGLEQYFKNRMMIQYIPNCSHWVPQEQPNLVAQYILQFVKQSDTSPH
jgi:pimeloyl-ACP methyl ester carboxylesterase